MKIETLIISPPDREGIAFEIWVDDAHVSEVWKSTEGLMVEFTAANHEQVNIPLEQLLSLLLRAKEVLKDAEPTPINPKP